MNIASLVVRACPADFPDVIEALKKTPGVELHVSSAEKGSIVITIEDGAGWSVTDSILAVNLAPKVQGLTVAYEYTDAGLELTEV